MNPNVVLLLLGVKAAIALGIIAGLLEFIPYVGPILSAVPAIAMAANMMLRITATS